MEYFAYLVANGIPPNDFWNMTLREIRAVCTAIDKKESLEMQRQSALIWRAGHLIGNGVASYFSPKIKYPSFKSEFGDLLKKEDGSPSSWEILRDRMNTKRLKFNRKRGGE